MESANREYAIIQQCLLYLYKEDSDLSKFINFCKSLNLSSITDRAATWLLNTFNYIEVKEKLLPDQIVILQALKLSILSIFLQNNKFYSSLIEDYSDPDLTTPLFENENGIIYKRYLPNTVFAFNLPEDGTTCQLTIKDQPYNSKKFDAKVEIDPLGYVISIIEEPSINVFTKKLESFSDIYTNLFDSVMKHDIS